MGDVALVGANGATDVTVAVAEEPRGRFGVPLAVISGLCLAASLPSLEIAPLAWIGLIPLLMAIRGRSLRAAFGLGWVTGTVFFLGTCYWIIHTIGHYTNVPVPLAAGVLLLMSSVLGVLPRRLRSRPALVRDAAPAGGVAGPRPVGDARVAARLVLHRLPVGRAGVLAVPLSLAGADGRGDRRLRRLRAAGPVQRGGGRGAAGARLGRAPQPAGAGDAHAPRRAAGGCRALARSGAGRAPRRGNAARGAGAGKRRAGPEVGSRHSRQRPWSATAGSPWRRRASGRA